MKLLRVLSVINALHFGGDESRLLSLSKSIDRNRFDHVVMTLKKPHANSDDTYGNYRPYFAAAGIDVIDLGDESPGLGRATGSLARVAKSASRLACVLIRLAKFVREQRIDVIDAHVGTGNEIGAAASVLTGVPAVLTTYQLEQFKPEWLWDSAERACFFAASAIVTDSEPVADCIRRKLVRPRPIAVIPNGIEPPSSARTSEEMRKVFGIPLDANARVIGQVSSLDPRKGHATLLDAAGRVLAQEANVHFVLCGYERVAGYADALRARARALGIADRVHFVSYPGPIGDVYRAIDVQVHASTGESLPNAIIEGMSLGKPAVVTAVAGIPAMVTDQETGLVVAPGEAEELARALLRLLREPGLARRLGAAARLRYGMRYTEEKMARALEGVFIEVVRKRGRTRY